MNRNLIVKRESYMDKKIINLYKEVYKKYDSLTGDGNSRESKGIRRSGLTITEYYMLADILTDVFNSPLKTSYTFSKGIADWCRKSGLKVTDPHDGDNVSLVNYTISLF